MACFGAEAFVNLHRGPRTSAWCSILTGRGTKGPVYMFQTSAGNTSLINALAQATGRAHQLV